jgi:CheY-like chemotaxis protein
MQQALENAAVANPVFIAEDGQKAIDYLSGAGPYGDRSVFPLPGLVFLDLKLPGIKGLDVLDWLRQQPSLCSVIVVVLTSSQEPSDLRRAYQLGAHSYLLKPSSTERLRALVKAVKDYWFEFNLFDSA